MEEKYTISPDNLIITRIPPKSKKNSELASSFIFACICGYLIYDTIFNYTSINNLVGSLMLLIVLFITMIIWFVMTLMKKPKAIMNIWTLFELNRGGVTFSAENLTEKKFYPMKQLSYIYPHISQEKSNSTNKIYQLSLMIKDLEGNKIQEIKMAINLERSP